jgi:polyisoprenoid-binding protein YceI
MLKHATLIPVFALALALRALAQAPAPAPGPGTWEVDTAHTTAGFSVKHMMVTNVHGSFGKVSGTIEYDGKDLSSIAADVKIDATSVTTNNERRDTHLRSADFFDVENHPAITFKSKRAEKGADGRFRLVGDLTMRGVTREVALDVEGPSQVVNAGRVFKIGASATTTVNRQDYGLAWNRAIEAGGVTVGDEVKIALEIQANRPNPNAPPAATR